MATSCTPCVRAKATCSGPPLLTKFVSNEIVVRFQASGILASNLKSICQQGLPGGASFGHYRLSSDEPRKNLTTVAGRLAGRLAARLVGFLAHEDAPWNVLANIGRIVEALHCGIASPSCVLLGRTPTETYRRNKWLTPPFTARLCEACSALIDNHKQQLKCETLAAATTLERLEVLFDSSRPYHRTRRAFGIKG
ncbi:hypothetical protein F5Y06DRAFT_18344 [Hypoxylon sp. FL0890]|nr:hypothetical protein F5Y06DRAFT_18344 [Hypoxylon sp. FL0890]